MSKIWLLVVVFILISICSLSCKVTQPKQQNSSVESAEMATTVEAMLGEKSRQRVSFKAYNGRTETSSVRLNPLDSQLVAASVDDTSCATASIALKLDFYYNILNDPVREYDTHQHCTLTTTALYEENGNTIVRGYTAAHCVEIDKADGTYARFNHMRIQGVEPNRTRITMNCGHDLVKVEATYHRIVDFKNNYAPTNIRMTRDFSYDNCPVGSLNNGSICPGTMFVEIPNYRDATFFVGYPGSANSGECRSSYQAYLYRRSQPNSIPAYILDTQSSEGYGRPNSCPESEYPLLKECFGGISGGPLGVCENGNHVTAGTNSEILDGETGDNAANSFTHTVLIHDGDGSWNDSNCSDMEFEVVVADEDRLHLDCKEVYLPAIRNR